MQASHIVFVENLLVKPTAVTATVWVSRENVKTETAPKGFADRILQAVPNVANHLCVGENVEFKSEIARTQTAHLFEHIVLDLLSYAIEGERSLGGHTSWDHTSADILETGTDASSFLSYRVTVKVPDDFVGVGVFTIAQTVLDWAWSGEGEMPNAYEIVDQLLVKRARY